VPVVFAKFSNALSGSGTAIELPSGDPQVDYEAELAIVIGQRARRVARDQALAYVAGYMNANDVSARSLQFRTSQWTLGKSLDGFCPVGPYLVTADEVDPTDLLITCDVNGERRQEARTSDLIFPCDELISQLSMSITLEAGDIILTGTPAGVAMGRPDRPWLRDGDRVVVEVEGLGRLENPVRQRPAG
jgi:2-keto-4-pentenoate hydratase/2-oxohepta-3-ene-1,7-dioic acid hydratase in catechol pathway